MRPFPPIFIIVLLAVFFSCTIEKRVHRPGYHIEWKKRLRPAEASGERRSFSVETPEAAAINELPAEQTDSIAIAETVPDNDSIRPLAEKQAIVPFHLNRQKQATPEIIPKEQRIDAFGGHMRKHAKDAQMDDLQKIVLIILIAVTLYVLLFLAGLIVGLVILDTAPIWGIVLLSISGLMAIVPLSIFILDAIKYNREQKEKARKTAAASGAFSARRSPFVSGRKKRSRFVPSPSDLIWLGILFIFIFLLYVALAVTGIVLGISLIVMGTYFWGILLLTLGSFLFLFPIIGLIIANRQDKKEEERKAADATGAFGPTVDS
jgi:hypothetical protein